MSYSNLFSALGLSVLLSACAHGADDAPVQAPNGMVPYTAEVASAREARPSRFERLQTSYLAYQDRPQNSSGGDVVVEYRTCGVWSGNEKNRCDLGTLVSESIAPGTQPSVW